MTVTSILLPHNRAGETLARSLPALDACLQAFAPYEILAIDASGDASPATPLVAALEAIPQLRILQLVQRARLGAALTVGIETAQGDQIVLLEPSTEYSSSEIKKLLQLLVRADLVYGRARRTGWAKAWRRVARIPRWALLGLEVRDPECMFWAARAEALAGLDLPRGMYRYLPNLVASRGYRVVETPCEPTSFRSSLRQVWPNPADLLAAWWLTRRPTHVGFREITSSADSASQYRGRASLIELNPPSSRRKSA